MQALWFGNSRRLVHRVTLPLVLAAVSVVVFPLALDAQERSPEQIEFDQILPDTTGLIVSIPHPDQVLDHLLSHPIRDDLEKLDAYQSALNSPQALQGKLLLGLFESQVGMTWPEAIKSITRHGLYIAGDPDHEAFAVLMRADSETNLRKVAGTLLNWVAKQAEDEGREVPFEIRDYRDFKVADFGVFIMARWKSWLLISNRKLHAKQIADNLLDGAETDTNLASANWYQQARSLEKTGDVWVGVNLKSLRERNIAQELFRGTTDDAAAELILGGILDVLEDSDLAAGQLNIGDRIDLSISVPLAADKIRSVREYYFGPELTGRAPQPIQPDGWIASLTSYRDLAGWWLSKEELFEERVIAQLAQTDSQLSTIFGGLDFGEEVLGSVQPGVQILAVQQDFEATPEPDVKLPSFGLVARLYDPASVRSRFKIAFQSLIGFINIELGQQGQPQLELDSDRVGDAFITTARYLIDQPDDYRLMIANFSPTIAFQDDYLIISSTRQLADQILAEVRQREPATVEANTLALINGAALKHALKQNAEALIAQNMLEQGNDRKTAQQQIDIFLRLLDFAKSAAVELKVHPNRLNLSGSLEFNLDE